MSPLRVLWALLIAVLAIGFTAPAQAQNVTAARPESVAEVIRGKGFEVEITKDSGGDPMINAEKEGTKFVVLFYGCTDGKNCATVGFYAGWSGTSAGMEKVNDWNRTQRFGRAYIDKEDDPCIEMDVDLDDGGMSRLLFEDNVEFWMTVMSQYSKFIFE
jgi:hypothetical protein